MELNVRGKKAKNRIMDFIETMVDFKKYLSQIMEIESLQTI
jgi:hypothetical protein